MCVFGVVVFDGWLAAGGGWGVLLGCGLTVGVFWGVSGRVGMRFRSGSFSLNLPVEILCWGWIDAESASDLGQ